MNHLKINKKIILTLTFVLSLQTAVAAEIAGGFDAKPTYPNLIKSNYFIYELKPGDMVEDYVTVKNFETYEQNFNIYGADKILTKQGDTAFKTKSDENTEVGTWITAGQETFTLKAKGETKQKITIKIPENIKLGDYEGAVLVEKSAVDQQNSGIKIVTRTAIKTEIKVTDTPKVIPKMEQKSIIKSYFYLSIIIFLSAIAYYTYETKKGH